MLRLMTNNKTGSILVLLLKMMYHVAEFDTVPMDCSHIIAVHCYVVISSNYVLNNKHM